MSNAIDDPDSYLLALLSVKREVANILHRSLTALVSSVLLNVGSRGSFLQGASFLVFCMEIQSYNSLRCILCIYIYDLC